MTQHTPVKVTGRTRDLVILVDKLIYRFTYHWVAFFNIMLLIFTIPIFVGPYLMAHGHQRAGRVLYALYTPMCHQLPERSFYLYGEKLTYTWGELVDAGLDPTLLPPERRHFLGSETLGYKTLVCQRDVVTYVGVIVVGALYGLFARRWLKPLPLWGFFLFLVPLAVDGMTQAAGLRESTPLLRTLTGLCVAIATVWFAYPHVEEAMADLRRDIAEKLHLES